MKKLFVFLLLSTCLVLTQPALAMKKIFVGNLSWDTTADEVKRLTSAYGPILEIVMIHDEDRHGQTTSAEVLFKNPEDANTAAAGLNGMVFKGATISSKPKEIVVVGSKVKEVIREAGLRTSNAALFELNDKIHDLIEEAIVRAKSNGRSTVRPYDL